VSQHDLRNLASLGPLPAGAGIQESIAKQHYVNMMDVNAVPPDEPGRLEQIEKLIRNQAVHADGLVGRARALADRLLGSEPEQTSNVAGSAPQAISQLAKLCDVSDFLSQSLSDLHNQITRLERL